MAKTILGDTTKCDDFCGEVVVQQDLRVFGWMTPGYPYVQVIHLLTKFMDVGLLLKFRGGVIVFVGNGDEYVSQPYTVILPPNKA